MSQVAEVTKASAAEWKDAQDDLRRVAKGMLRESCRDLTELDRDADELRRVADRIGEVVASGHDPMHGAAVALAEASEDPEKVHGELVFDPRPLEDTMVDLPIGGEWHPRGEVPMPTTALPVVVPRPETETDTVERGAIEVGTAEWRADCRGRVKAALDFHRSLLWEDLLPQGNGSEGGA